MSTDSIDEIYDFELAVGEVTALDGRTSVRVDREGQFLVTHEWIEDDGPEPTKDVPADDQRGRRREESRGDVRELDIEPVQLLRQAAGLPQGREFPPRPGIPDEPIVTVEIRSASGTRVERMWLRDAEKEFAGFTDSLRTIVTRATDGRRYL
jgi:hypothetical protein